MPLLLFIVAVWLWWPLYDLEIALERGPSNYVVVKKNFLTLDSCRDAVGNYVQYDWSCLDHTTWGAFFNKDTSYNGRER